MQSNSKVSGPEDGFDAQFLSQYLPQRLDSDAVRILALVKYPRGVSRETWFLSCEVMRGPDTNREDFVLRRDLPSGSICLGDLRSEYEVYRRLNQSGVPVAQTLWYEDDPQRLEGRRAFFVRRHVDGDWDVPHALDPDPRYNNLRLEVGREHVRKLAQVHSCDWKALGFGEILEAPRAPEDCAVSRIRAVIGEIERLRIQPLPLVSEAAEWFLDHQPPHSGRVCLVKGTNGYGEEVFLDGRIVAMSDWELCCLGDPAMDFALAQNFLDDIWEEGKQIWGMEQALQYYFSLTGIAIDMRTVDYYKRLYGLYRIQYSQAAASQLEQGGSLCRLAWVGVEVLHLGQMALASTIGCTAQQLPEMGQR